MLAVSVWCSPLTRPATPGTPDTPMPMRPVLFPRALKPGSERPPRRYKTALLAVAEVYGQCITHRLVASITGTSLVTELNLLCWLLLQCIRTPTILEVDAEDEVSWTKARSFCRASTAFLSKAVPFRAVCLSGCLSGGERDRDAQSAAGWRRRARWCWAAGKWRPHRREPQPKRVPVVCWG
eukprot:SAG22_NODE_2071_length_3051_cov_4.999661_3_plen_181_part_00